ncbi:MAG: hypothetical protein ABS81_27830 [Pseudonocardia sp. SCN 72-86]|nr:MAG: hypothetical protein ABS81_27830 [Pseudonocardia sp. SCN 72-86]
MAVWSPADGFPVLRTARTVLRELTHADADALFAFRSDPEEQRHNDSPLTEPGQALELVDRLAREYRERSVVRWGLEFGGTVVGLLGFNSWDAHHDRADVGYDLSRRLWGQGLAAEAMAAVLDFGFDRMALQRIEIWTESANTRSVRMAERLGFVREGTLRGYVRADDGETRHDVDVFGLLRGDR